MLNVKRRTFCFTPKTESLLEKLHRETELSYSVVIKLALELFAERKGVSND